MKKDDKEILDLYDQFLRFKVGDKVKVKGNDEVGEITQYNDWLSLSKYYLVEFTDESHWYTEKDLEPYTEPRWTFTDDEKVILRNLPKEYKWIARDKNDDLFIYRNCPIKDIHCWDWDGLISDNAKRFFYDHLFQSIKWEDTEACEFRKYL